jgi:hypothetical protein
LVISFDNMNWNWSSHSSWILFYFQVLSHHSCLEAHRKPESWQKRKNLMYKSRTACRVSSPLRESFPLHLLQIWDEVQKRNNPNFAVLERQMWTVLIGLSFTWCLHEVRLISCIGKMWISYVEQLVLLCRWMAAPIGIICTRSTLWNLNVLWQADSPLPTMYNGWAKHSSKLKTESSIRNFNNWSRESKSYF